MELYENSEDDAAASKSRAAVWLGLIGFLVLAAAVAGLGIYAKEQKEVIRELGRRQVEANATIYQLQSQLYDASDKMNEMAAQQAVIAQDAVSQAAQKAQPAARAASAAENARLRRLQAALDDAQKQLQSTQDDVAKTRSDLEGTIGSTRDDLSGAIAKNHDELVLLQKRGERDYAEFDAAKSKEFERVGPVSLSIRRVDPKHGNLDLVVLVNDREISKKKVNLYEPVWIYESKDAQPTQVVVNQIGKNSVHGYVSAPKYSAIELRASAAGFDPAPTLHAPSGTRGTAVQTPDESRGAQGAETGGQ